MVLRTALAQVRRSTIDVEFRPLSDKDATYAARGFLDWFEQGAPEDAQKMYIPNSDMLMRYRDCGGMHNAIDYVTRMAMSRYDEANAQRVIDAARALLA